MCNPGKCDLGNSGLSIAIGAKWGGLSISETPGILAENSILSLFLSGAKNKKVHERGHERGVPNKIAGKHVALCGVIDTVGERDNSKVESK